MNDPHEETKQNEQQLTRNNNHHVRFGTVQIRTFPVTLGVHPATKTGPPVEMDWKPLEQFVMSLDDYEQTHTTTTTTTESKSTPDDFFLTAAQRTELLQQVGFTKQEIADAIAQIKAIIRQRRETIANMRFDWREEKKEERRNKWKKRFQAFKRGKSEKELICCDTAEDAAAFFKNKKIDAYVDEHRTVQPMFDGIPCTHCSNTFCIGDGCDAPAGVGMFRCDGTTCRKGTNCPFKRRLSGTGGTRTNSAIVAPAAGIPQAVA